MNILIPVCITAVLIVIGYIGLEYKIFTQLTKVDPASSINLPNTPERFKVRGGPFMEFDTRPYEMSHYENVRFPSRQTNVQLAGWYIKGEPSAPVVLLTHGIRQCKSDSNVLTAAGMMHRNGFNILLIDLRNHGQSDVVSGRTGFGSTEYQDILGGWDWLIERKRFIPQQIGLYGVSMGAAATLITFAQEPRIASVFVDSPFFSVIEVLADELERYKLPRFLAPGAIWVGRFITGDNLLSHNPQEGLRKNNDRPIYMVHGTLDKCIDIHHHYEYELLAQQIKAKVTHWVVTDAGHGESEFVFPIQYEQRLVEFFQNTLRTIE
jgi:dipeptidyl aminopeptidase/acylaminoacyl peptidase